MEVKDLNAVESTVHDVSVNVAAKAIRINLNDLEKSLSVPGWNSLMGFLTIKFIEDDHPSYLYFTYPKMNDRLITFFVIPKQWYQENKPTTIRLDILPEAVDFIVHPNQPESEEGDMRISTADSFEYCNLEFVLRFW